MTKAAGGVESNFREEPLMHFPALHLARLRTHACPPGRTALRRVAAATIASAVALLAWSAIRTETAPSPQGSPVTAQTAAAVNAPALDLSFLQDLPVTEQRFRKLKSGDTLASVLIGLGASRQDADAAAQAAFTMLKVSDFQAGKLLTATFERVHGAALDATRLAGLSMRLDVDRSMTVSRDYAGSFNALDLRIPLTPVQKLVRAEITTTLYEAALDAGAVDQVVVDFADVFAFDVDFQRDIHPGDRFEILFESLVDPQGRALKSGRLLYLSLESRGKEKAFWRHERDGEEPDYFDETGESARKFLMKTPINGARLSSGFGLRRHPVLGYNRLHKGTDFAAPTGTPIFAAGSGTVLRANWFSSYGRYVRIRHNGEFETAYAHLSRFASGIQAGSRVRQGQVIGYVGTTGRSTGPHLHYEILRNGAAINPSSIKTGSGVKLEGAALDAFQAVRAKIDAERAAAAVETPLAPSFVGAAIGN